MAIHANNITRRSVLAGTLALPAIATMPALAAETFDPARWVEAYLANGGTLRIHPDAFVTGLLFDDCNLGNRLLEISNEGDNRKRIAAHVRSHRPELVATYRMFEGDRA